MSTQSILELNREAYLQKAEDNLLRMSDAYFFNKRFRMGEGVDEDKLDFYFQMQRLLCTDNCEMKDFIQNKIEGKLEECDVKPKSSQKLTEILELAKQYLEMQDCSLSDVASCVANWDSVEW